MSLCNDNFFILTGAMGAGKSTVIKFFEDSDIICIPEPARKILYEQRLIVGKGVPEDSPDIFTQLVLSRATNYYMLCSEEYRKRICLFDRGIPDMIAYAELFGLDTEVYYNAAKMYEYNLSVFLFEGWGEIYVTDDERRMTYAQAERFGERIAEIYKELGYDVITVPKTESPLEL